MASTNFRFLLALVVLLFILTSPFILPTRPVPNFDTEVSKEKREGLQSIENEREVTLLLTGDVMLGRTVMRESLNKSDPSYPFRKVADKLRSADLVFVNLENPIIANCPAHEGGFVFCATPEMTEGLVYSGVDIVNLANNHSKNYDESALSETVEILDQRGILATGLEELVVIERGEVNFGFLGFDFTLNEPTPADYGLIRNSDGSVDVLIIGVHWGVEYTSKPQEYQREWARSMVEAGADVIAGHHPHWVQSFEEVNAKPVFYSLGNFVFDQMWSEETREGVAVELAFKGGSLQNTEFLPIYMQNWAQPEFIE